MRVHFIAIGGAAMHNLALALHKKGFHVSGSDDEIFDPSKTRLEQAGILPEQWGWFPNKITTEIDAIILGMHARIDNPELIKAKELNLKIYSYPEYIYEQTKDKTRVVIGGSHGKTTTTSMIMHVLKCNNINFDYMVGAQIEGFETMVKLSEDAKIAVFEGDEYLASPIDPRPKFHLYHPHIALLTGIAWDHINVFPTFENYLDQFEKFINFIKPQGSLIYFDEDEHILKMVQEQRDNISYLPYNSHPHKVKDGVSSLITKDGEIELSIFGEHNLQNLKGAHLICKELGLSDEQFYTSIQSFGGAAKRLQTLAQNNQTIVYQDFAHSPSKLQATTKAVKNQFTDRKLVACMELHTFSSLKEEFLPEYKNSMALADVAMVYFNPKTVEHKKLKAITTKQVHDAFGGTNLKVYTDSQELLNDLMQLNFEKANLLLMSSGNFSGLNLKELANQLVQ